MYIGRRIGRLLAVLLVILSLLTIGITGCEGQSELPAAYRYEFSENSSNLDEKAGQQIPWQGEALCVIDDESAYVDPAILVPVAVLLDLTNRQVLFSKNAHQQMHPASLTTLATALVVLNHMELSDQVTVSEDALKDTEDTSVVGLEAGDKLTVEQLLHGMLMCSGVDAANALAIASAGSVEKFVKWMNQETREIGCTECNFKNPGGMTAEGHYMSAYDTYMLLNKLMENPQFMSIFTKDYYECTYENRKGEQVKQDYESTVAYLTDPSFRNSFKGKGVSVLGGKTGTTLAARHCLAVCAQDENGNYYVGIVMSAGTRDQLYDQMDQLINKIVK